MDRWLRTALALPGLEIAPLLASIAVDSVRLPGEFHADPVDRIIVATARFHRIPLMTADQAILSYAALGHVNASGYGLRPMVVLAFGRRAFIFVEWKTGANLPFCVYLANWTRTVIDQLVRLFFETPALALGLALPLVLDAHCD